MDATKEDIDAESENVISNVKILQTKRKMIEKTKREEGNIHFISFFQNYLVYNYVYVYEKIPSSVKACFVRYSSLLSKLFLVSLV